MGGWETLGTVPPAELAPARLELHWAMQAASSVGKLLLPPAHDFSQQSLGWDPRVRALAQAAVVAARPFRSALSLDPPALALLDVEGADLARLPLSGHTLDEAYTWLERAVEALLGRPLPGPLERPGELPAHPVRDGGAFSNGGPAFVELGRYFADFASLLSDLAMETPGASPVRLWPHHGDLATLVEVDMPMPGGADPARSIGIGMTPGDAERPAPYLYVTPWPYPQGAAIAALPPLPAGGVWNVDGWVGAVLDAEALVAAGDGPAQRSAAMAFLDAAVAASRRLLGG